MRISVLLFGGDNGYCNVGDQAMLINTVHRLRRFLAGCQVTVLAHRPDRLPELDDICPVRWPVRGETLRRQRRLWRAPALIDGLRFVAMARALRETGRLPGGISPGGAELLRLLEAHDLLVNYGSGGLTDIWARSNVYPWSFCLLAARRLQKRIVVTGQGIGPLPHPVDRRLLCAALNGADVVTLRDCRASAELLERGGVRRPLVRVTADDAASLDPAPPEAASAALAHEGVTVIRPFIVFHVRGTAFDRSINDTDGLLIASVADRLVEVTNGRILFVSLANDTERGGVDDRVAARAVVSRMRHARRAAVLRRAYTPAMVRGLIAEADLAVGMSYHFLLFALTKGIPAVGLYKGRYYQTKLHGLFGHFDLSAETLDLETSDVETVVRRALRLLRAREALAERLQTTAHRLDAELDEVWNYIHHRMQSMVVERDKLRGCVT